MQAVTKAEEWAREHIMKSIWAVSPGGLQIQCVWSFWPLFWCVIRTMGRRPGLQVLSRAGEKCPNTKGTSGRKTINEKERFEIVVILTLSLHFPGFRVLSVIRSGCYYGPPEWVQNVPIKNTGEEDAETNNLVWSSLKQHWLLQQNIICFNCSSFVVGALKWLLCFITANHCQYTQLNLFSD